MVARKQRGGTEQGKIWSQDTIYTNLLQSGLTSYFPIMPANSESISELIH
jgi:hypothetical protein